MFTVEDKGKTLTQKIDRDNEGIIPTKNVLDVVNDVNDTTQTVHTCLATALPSNKTLTRSGNQNLRLHSLNSAAIILFDCDCCHGGGNSKD
jgi:hypothetical protein